MPFTFCSCSNAHIICIENPLSSSDLVGGSSADVVRIYGEGVVKVGHSWSLLEDS